MGKRKLTKIVIIVLCAASLLWLHKEPVFHLFNRAQNEYRKCAKNSVLGKNWLNMTLDVEWYDNGVSIGHRNYTLSYSLKEEKAIFLSYDINDILKNGNATRHYNYKISKQKTLFVDFLNKRIFDADLFSMMFPDFLSMRNEVENNFRFMPYYTQVMPYIMQCQANMLNMQSFHDTIVNGHQCRQFIGTTQERLAADTTGKFNLPIRYECTTWVNMENSLIDSVIAEGTTDYVKNERIVYRITEANFSDMTDYYGPIFDFDNICYKDYTHEDFAYTSISNEGTETESLSHEVLSFPIVNLKGDTTSISTANGWILLDFWGFGCGGCVKGFKQLKQEKDTLGFRVVEKENIVPLLTNPDTDNMKYIQKIGEHYGIADIIYSSKGFLEHIGLVNGAMPSYYLISPDKQIVWRGNHLGDYSELLKAKEDYEKTQKTN